MLQLGPDRLLLTHTQLRLCSTKTINYIDRKRNWCKLFTLRGSRQTFESDPWEPYYIGYLLHFIITEFNIEEDKFK